MVEFESLIVKLEGGQIERKEFDTCLGRISKNFDIQVDLELLRFYGLPIVLDEEYAFFETTKTLYKDEVYCVVDIETNGNSPIKNQIIELGAIKYQNGKVIEKFDSFVYAESIPYSISKLTNIYPNDLKDAPSLKKVLYDFKLFLGSSVFVAHNVNFDYSFISKSLKTVDLDELLNRKLCTVELAKKTIKAPRHGLGFLREMLHIETGDHHRAYSDALSAAKVLDECFKFLPEEVTTTEDLIKFSQTSNRKKKRRKEYKEKSE